MSEPKQEYKTQQKTQNSTDLERSTQEAWERWHDGAEHIPAINPSFRRAFIAGYFAGAESAK
jgi:hypothetical protein